MRKPWWAWGCHGQYTETDMRNFRLVNIWILTWGLSFVVVSFTLSRDLVPARWLDIGLVALTMVPAALMIRAYARFLRSCDELLRKIHLEAFAAGFGAGMVFMWGYRLFERLGAPELGVEDPVTVMIFTWAIAMQLGMRRYA